MRRSRNPRAAARCLPQHQEQDDPMIARVGTELIQFFTRTSTPDIGPAHAGLLLTSSTW